MKINVIFLFITNVATMFTVHSCEGKERPFFIDELGKEGFNLVCNVVYVCLFVCTQCNLLI